MQQPPSTPATHLTGPRAVRWPVVALFFVLASVAAVLLGLVQPSTGVPPDVVQLQQFGPAVAVGLLVLLRIRPPAVRPVIPTTTGRLATALLAAAGIVIWCAAASALGAPIVDGAAFDALAQPVGLVVLGQVAGACGEELGWRGFLQPYLQTRLGPLPAAVLVGLLWGAWHPQVYTAGPVLAVLFLVQAVALSVVLAALVGDRLAVTVAVAGGFHAVVNLVLLAMPAVEGSVGPSAVFTAGCALVAALAVAGRPALRRAPATRSSPAG